MDLIVRVVYNGVTYDLDIDGNIPLRLDVSAVENGDIGNFFGVGSQAFDLPGTKNNNKFFKHGYEIGAEDIPAFYNSIDGYIIYNGETLLEGQFQLMEILTDESGFITYRCQITDSVVQFKDSLASSLVKDADWSAYNHTLSNLNITASWNDDLLSGSVYYPIGDYGRGDKDTYPTIPRLQLGTEVGAIGSPSSPLQPKQFLPAIKLKDTLDVLFDQVGYRYTGSFTEREDFNNMYILNKPNDELGVVVGEDSTATFSANSSALNQVYIRNTEGDISASTEISDPLNAYNTTTSKYTYLDDGEYTLQGQVAFFNPVATDPASDVRVTLELRSGLDNTAYTLVDSEEINLTYLDGFGTKYLNVANSEGLKTTGDDAWLYLKYEQTAGGGTANNLTLIGSSVQFQCTSAPISYNGALVNMGLQWNPTLKSLDVVKGVISQFNLVMTPIYGVNQLIQIEQFDEWIRMGQVKDWTDKYQTAKRVGINHTVNEQQRELLLKNVDDNDRFSKLSQENEPNFQYGTLRLLSDNNISQGTKKIADFFAPVVLGGSLIPFESGSDGTPTYNIDFNTRFVLPHLYKYDNNKQQSFAFKPRIGYKVTNTLPSGSVINIGTTSDYVSVSGSYSTISNLSELPAISGSSFDLHFSNDYANFSFSNLGFDNGTTSFERYWKTYLDSLYWEDSRKITLDLEFDAYEYKNINLNDIIFIKNQQYRINKITGYNLTANDVVTVELIKLYPAYYVAEAIPTTTTTTTTTAAPTTTSTTTSTTAAPTTTTTTSTTAAPTTTTTTSTTAAPTTTTTTSTTVVEYSYYSATECGDVNTINVRSVSTLSIGNVVKIFGTCYEIDTIGGAFGFDYTDLYTTCVECQGVTTTTTSTTAAPTTTTTTSTTIAPCQCLTVDVLNTQLTDGGLDLYYILNDCGGGDRDVNLATSIGTEQGGSTYFGLCGGGTLSNIFKYGPSGTPFTAIAGMNVNGSATVCTLDGDCPPVVPTTTTTTSTTSAPTTTTSTTAAPTTTTTTSTTSFPTTTTTSTTAAPTTTTTSTTAAPTTTTTTSTTAAPTTTSTTTSTTAAPNVFVAERNFDGFGSYLQYDGAYSSGNDVLASDGFCWTLGTPSFVLDPTIYGTITSLCPPPTTTTTTSTTALCNSVSILVSTVSAEDAYCNQVTNRTVYHNGSTWADATLVYGTSSDCSTLQAGNRWYSDGSNTWFWNGSTKTLISNPACP